MLLRLRSRDGLERIEVPDNATVAALRKVINEKLGVPLDGMHLSKEAGLLTTKEPYSFRDLAITDASLKSVGVAHGDMLYLLYSIEREVAPVVKVNGRRFGECVTLGDVIAKQVKIERQEKAKAESISFDRSAANAFQAYIQGAYQFSIKRGGILYGTVDEQGAVRVDFIYEPPQEGSAESLTLERNTPEEQQVEFLAGLLGYRKVGVIFSQSIKQKAGEYIINTQELQLMAGVQDEVGEFGVSVLVTWEEGQEGAPGQVHFEAFQCSEQAVRLAREGWIKPREQLDGVSCMVNPNDPSNKEPVMLGTKDVSEVDNDFFLCAVKILDHEGALSSGAFPIENRLTPQTKAELRDVLKRGPGKADYTARLSDFHLLLWLSKQPNLDPHDMALLCEAIKSKQQIMEGYRVIIECIAGIQ